MRYFSVAAEITILPDDAKFRVYFVSCLTTTPACTAHPPADEFHLTAAVALGWRQWSFLRGWEMEPVSLSLKNKHDIMSRQWSHRIHRWSAQTGVGTGPSLVVEISESVGDLAVIVRKYSERKSYLDCCGCCSCFPDNHILSGLLRVSTEVWGSSGVSLTKEMCNYES